MLLQAIIFQNYSHSLFFIFLISFDTDTVSDFIFVSYFESLSIYHHDQGVMIINHCGGSPEITGISSLSAAHSVNTSIQLQLSTLVFSQKHEEKFAS